MSARVDALFARAGDHARGNLPDSGIILGLVGRRVAEMVEAGFHEVEQPRVLRLDIFHQFEQQMFGRDLALAGHDGGGVGHVGFHGVGEGVETVAGAGRTPCRPPRPHGV
ncbi:hypothetical protein SPHINGOT1_20230 [Sphingomonas sp. T1]|nr:hypothetical protein SPHINGOT1_20230 [Sphingomonas sp. T1]